MRSKIMEKNCQVLLGRSTPVATPAGEARSSAARAISVLSQLRPAACFCQSLSSRSSYTNASSPLLRVEKALWLAWLCI